MDKSVAKQKFSEADELYRAGEFEQALTILRELDDAHPDTPRLMFPMARCLYKLGNHQEALDICMDLTDEHDYEKAEPLQRKLRGLVYQEAANDWDGEEDEGDIEEKSVEGIVTVYGIKPIRLLALVGIIYAMYAGYLPYWLGGGIIAAYFVIKTIVKLIVYRLFSMPFILKGKALAGAGATVHNVAVAEPPKDFDPSDFNKDVSFTFYKIEVTIVPQERSEGFTHWEPSELMIAPLSQRIKKLDDLEKAFEVWDMKMLDGDAPSPDEAEDDSDSEDDGDGKYAGPRRIQITVGLPPGGGDFKFAYYTQSFGQFSLPPA